MFKKLPETGISKDIIISELTELRNKDADWRKGRVFSLVFYPGDDAANVVQEAYKLFSSENGLNPTVFKSLKQ
ncbi:MAG: aspartate aminotransferase family protein, partial [Bacteroidetes bacterium]|nr:aspartate aminotransferase family protein [Bacteroidota bacterium]